MADLRLQVILTALDKVTGPLKKIRDATNPTAKAAPAPIAAARTSDENPLQPDSKFDGRAITFANNEGFAAATSMGNSGVSRSRVSLCRIFGASIRSAEAPSASLNARVDGKRCAGFFDKAFNSAPSTRGSRPGTRGIRRSGR